MQLIIYKSFKCEWFIYETQRLNYWWQIPIDFLNYVIGTLNVSNWSLVQSNYIYTNLTENILYKINIFDKSKM